MSLKYALITDSSLPNKVKESDYFVEVEKDQWLDLIDYSEEVVSQDSSQNILFLIVAKGTPEQDEADRLRQEEEALKSKDLESKLKHQKELDLKNASLDRKAKEAKESLRKKSKTIYNALYKH